MFAFIAAVLVVARALGFVMLPSPRTSSKVLAARNELREEAERLQLLAETLRLEAFRDELLIARDRRAPSEPRQPRPPKRVAIVDMSNATVFAGTREYPFYKVLRFMVPNIYPRPTMTREDAVKIGAVAAQHKEVFACRVVEWSSTGILLQGQIKDSPGECLRRFEKAFAEYRVHLVREIPNQDSTMRLANGEGIDAALRPAILVMDRESIYLPIPARPPAVDACAWVLAAVIVVENALSYASSGNIWSGVAWFCTLQLVSELGHAAMKLRLGADWWQSGVPFPTPRFGSWGPTFRITAYAPKRTDLFDVALAGPAVGLVASLVCVAFGARSSVALADPPRIPIADLRHFGLAMLVATAVAPDIFSADDVPVHPLFLAGLANSVSNAVRLLPLGRATRGGLALATMLPGFYSCFADLEWGFAILAAVAATLYAGGTLDFGSYVINAMFLQENLYHVRCRDDVSPVDPARARVFAALLFLSLLTLAPYPLVAELFSTFMNNFSLFETSSLPPPVADLLDAPLNAFPFFTTS